MGGRLPCSFVTLAVLGSYALQSELGEHDPDVHGPDYAKEMKMAQGQTKELEDQMMELHRTYSYLLIVSLCPRQDLDGVDITLGVCSSGLMVYKDKLRINRFPWPKVLKVSYKRSSFFIKIRPSELRKDILGGRLPCSFVTLAVLGSYALQSELGEHDPDVHGPDYAKEMKMAQGQTKELEDQMMELHRTYRFRGQAGGLASSLPPVPDSREAAAEAGFCRPLVAEQSTAGPLNPEINHSSQTDLDGVDITLGVCSSGLMVYKDKLRINRFPWPKVLKVSYKRSSFFIKIRPSEVERDGWIDR
ncbi:unnamed protein product [Menidia menidia]|uniref:Protein 4.1 n=1 Tax=Menidia menidia TaxID=238744 RepID=A0A8S4AZ05_9TELE|nr:unnamed protein product [Menidia menidia]